MDFFGDRPVLKGSVDWGGKMPGSGPSGKELVDVLAPCWSMDTFHSGRNVPETCLGPKEERSKKKKRKSSPKEEDLNYWRTS